ncbi:ferritin [Elysia marginata]|uniref:Ferritin n=1 Tax=Elysia marginata TaxID=1093978 RepID=A0AAV4GA05_9GAST|nr:ferritin [Elysia marginata]
MQLYASYCYQSLSYYFDRDDVALAGFAKYFKKASDEEREHGEKFMTYQNKRGGRIILQDIKKPEFEDITCLKAMEIALTLRGR